MMQVMGDGGVCDTFCCFQLFHETSLLIVELHNAVSSRSKFELDEAMLPN
jgi:hypothetical protein